MGLNPGFGPLKGNHQQGMVLLGVIPILIPCLRCPKRIELLTFRFSVFGPFVVKVPYFQVSNLGVDLAVGPKWVTPPWNPKWNGLNPAVQYFRYWLILNPLPTL